MASKDKEISAQSVRIAVLSAMFEPPLTLARLMGLSLDDVHELVTHGYFDQFRRQGLSLRQMSSRFGRSLRTLATLSKSSTERHDLLSGSQRLEIQRQVARALTKKQSRASLRRRLRRLDDESFDQALGELEAMGLIEQTAGGYVSRERRHSMVREDLDARIESLRHLLSAITAVVHRRFFEGEGQALAFARVLSFNTSSEAAKAAVQERYDGLREWVTNLDDINEDGASASLVFCVVETPTGPQWK